MMDAIDMMRLQLARDISRQSMDPVTRVGCIIVGPQGSALGANGLARGVHARPERLERPAKYDALIHAEIRAIAHAAREGVSLRGSTAYVWLAPSETSSVRGGVCARCAAALIEVGVIRLVMGARGEGGRYGFDLAREMLREAGVVVEALEDENERLS